MKAINIKNLISEYKKAEGNPKMQDDIEEAVALLNEIGMLSMVEASKFIKGIK